MKKALVTGSDGFVGSHLVEALENHGYKVFGFDIKKGHDITNADQISWDVLRVDVVFNLAGLLGTHELIEDDTVKAAKVNIIGALNVLEAARKYEVDVVEIGKPNLWLNTYSITKQAAEDFSVMYHREHGTNVWIVKWFNIYGPRQHYGKPQKLAPTSIVKALKNEPIPVFGDGKQTADHIYVKDAVEAAIAIYNCKKVVGKPVEVGHHHMSINDFVKGVIKQTGSKSKIDHLPMRKGEDDYTVVKADTRVLEKVVKFKPKFSFEDGLKETIKYYKEEYVS